MSQTSRTLNMNGRHKYSKIYVCVLMFAYVKTIFGFMWDRTMDGNRRELPLFIVCSCIFEYLFE